MKKSNFILLSILLLSLLGCVNGGNSTNTVFQPTPAYTKGNAMLYLYRPAASSPGIAKPLRFSYPEVFIDGKSYGPIEYDRYMPIELTPGEHQIRLTGLTAKAKDWERRDIDRTIKVSKGESKFMRFRVEYNLAEMNLGQPKSQYSIFLTPVREEDAIYEIRKIKPMR